MTAHNPLQMPYSDVTAIIPARYASSRFPGKPLAKICGIPMILQAFKRVAAVIPESQILIATDDDRIAEVCSTAGARVAMTPADCLTGTDRIWKAVEAGKIDSRIIVNVQGDEPLVEDRAIRAVIEAKRENPDCVINAMSRIEDPDDVASPNVPKVVTDARGHLVYMSRAPVPFIRDVETGATHYRQVCIYAFSRTELKAFGSRSTKSHMEGPEDIEILRFLDMNVPVKMVEVAPASIAVDTPQDLRRVEKLLETAI